MAQVQPAQMMLLTATLLLAFTAASATNFTVGDKLGWTKPNAVNGLNYTALLNTTTFVVGDSLVFNYDPVSHNVLSVTGTAFATCNVSEPLEKFTDGNTVFTFPNAGRWWFICGTPGHCSAGQAFKVTVLEKSSPASGPESGSGNGLVQSWKAALVVAMIVGGYGLL